VGWRGEEALECNAATNHGPSPLLPQCPAPNLSGLLEESIYFAVHIFLPAYRTPGTGTHFLLVSVVFGAGR